MSLISHKEKYTLNYMNSMFEKKIGRPFKMGFTGHTESGDFRGFSPLHPTSTVEVNSGDRTVWEIFIAVRTST